MTDNIIELTADIAGPEEMSIEVAEPVSVSIPVSCAGSNVFSMKPSAIGTPLESSPILIVSNNSMRFTISGSASRVVLSSYLRDRTIEISAGNSAQPGYTVIGVQNISLQNVSSTSGVIYGIGSTMRRVRIALDGSTDTTINATGTSSSSSSRYWTLSYSVVYLRNDLVIKER